MKTYNNFRYNLMEDDDIEHSEKTNYACLVLTIIAIAVLVTGILFTIALAKAEAKEHNIQLEQEFCNLMEFNGSTYTCGENK